MDSGSTRDKSPHPNDPSPEIPRRQTPRSSPHRKDQSFEVFIETAPIGVFTIDKKGRFIFANKALEDMTGYAFESWRDRNFEPAVHPEDMSLVKTKIDEVLATQALIDPFEVRIIDARGDTKWVEIISDSIVTDDAGIVGFQSYVRDITSQKKAENRMLQSERMAALGNLVAGVAHEINTPLSVSAMSSSYLNDLSQRCKAKLAAGGCDAVDFANFVDSAAEATAMITANLRRAAELLNSFKQVAVDQAHDQGRSFDLKTTLDEVIGSLRPHFKRTTHTLQLVCPEGVQIKSYPGALAQIVTNLVMNSLIHGFETMENGQMRLTISPREMDVIMTYTDNGRGMDAETLQRMYDPFFTSKRDQGSSGLGMQIVYNLVTQKIKGDIDCTSTPGNGVTVVIRLPRQKDSSDR